MTFLLGNIIVVVCVGNIELIYMEETGMARVTKDTTIGEVIQIDAGVIPILMGAGMHCVGCPSSAGETLEEAAMVHGIDSDMLVEEIQSYLQSLG